MNSDDHEDDIDLPTAIFPCHDIRKYVCDKPTNITATTTEVVEQTPIFFSEQENTSVLPQIYPVGSKATRRQEVEMLVEMFPDLSRKAIEDALIASQNDVEMTVNCLLAGNKPGQCLKHTSKVLDLRL